MQDIAGIRFLYKPSDGLHDILKQGVVTLGANYTLKKSFDYLESPKDSGYRAYHQVFEFHLPEMPEYDGLPVEVQYRTYEQHYWAMAVETAGMIYRQSLKSSLGDQDWLDFFRLTSAIVSTQENMPVCGAYRDISPDIIRQELQRDDMQRCLARLRAVRRVQDFVLKSENCDYWILDLNLKTGNCEINGFTEDQMQLANEFYSLKEQQPACLRGDSQVVLVSSRQFGDLRDNYPSYFLDVSNFLTMIERF
jgi:hypothetical protein